MKELSIEENMKETIEEKAKRFDEVIEKLRNFYRDYDTVSRLIDVKEELANLIPELKESEDEKIRKYILSCCEETIKANDRGLELSMETTIKLRDWLEKQGVQKPVDKIQLGKKYKCIASPKYSTFMTGKIYKPEDKFLCSLMNFCYDCFEPIEEDEQKPVVKVESKFHKGDWVVDKDGHISQIMRIDNDFNHITYACRFLGKKLTYWLSYSENDIRLWDISDAKDGDVLASNRSIFIFSQEYIAEKPEAHCGIMNGLFIAKPEGCWTNKQCYPATKEQRDTLFAKIKEAGYEWDAEKKELKKIEHKPAWSEEDEIRLRHILHLLDVKDDKRYILRFGLNSLQKLEKDIAWLKSIKGRVTPQPKQEWSEEDEKMLNLIIAIFEVNHPNGHFKANELDGPNMKVVYTEEIVTWLKLFKGKIQPKQEWSVCYEDMLNDVEESLEAYSTKLRSEKDFSLADTVKKEIEWIKSLKEGVACEANCTKQWKPSEEDKAIFDRANVWLNNLCDYLKNCSSDCIPSEIKNIIKKLESFKERCIWKPSDEQIDAIKVAISYMTMDYETPHAPKVLKELLEQLKKLKEE